MEEIDRRHYRIRQAAQEGTGVFALPRERKRGQDRNGLHRSRPRSDHLPSPVREGARRNNEGGQGEEGWAQIGHLILWHRHSCLCESVLVKEASTGRSAGATQASLVLVLFLTTLCCSPILFTRTQLTEA